MSNVLHKITKVYLQSVNTPNYPPSEYLINPILPLCEQKFWVIEGDTIREMTQPEKDAYEYANESTIYLIAEKQLLTNQDGAGYAADANAITDPVMPNVDLKYTKVVSGEVVEMTPAEQDAVDLPARIAKRNRDVVGEIRKSYSDTDEIEILRELAFGDLLSTDTKAKDWKDAVAAAKAKHPKVT